MSHVSDEIKIMDIRLVLHAAVHGTISSIDHLCELLKKCGKGSKLENLRLHRTKASNIILHVVAPSFLKDIIDDIGDQGFSIILDESTDVSTVKYLAYCVRYFSLKSNQIVTDFLGFSEVTDTTAQDLYVVFTKFLREVGLQKQKLIGIGTDGASNLCGVRNSLYTLLKNDVPSLQLVRCTCHSIDLCANKASEELPSSLLFLLRETNNFFAHSALRQSNYNDLYKDYNAGSKPAKFIPLSTTRWLVIYSANSVILKQWEETKLFFTNAAKAPSNKCYLARTLASMYNDDTNLVYLIFLDGILKDVHALNLAFQHNNADITRLYAELRLLLLSLARRIFKPAFLRPLTSGQDSSSMLHQTDLDAVKRCLDHAHDNFGDSLLSLDSRDLGEKFDNVAREKHLDVVTLQAIKERATLYIIRLCRELWQRLPQNLTVIDRLKYLSPSTCLSENSILARNLPWDLAGDDVDRDAIEKQWRSLQSEKLADIVPNAEEQVKVVDFWIAVWNIKNLNGQRTYGDLSLFALRVLSLPTSNAQVERVFSIMAAVKTKVRNRMLMPMLVALIGLIIHLSVLQLCCENYVPSKDMLSRFNKNMYEKRSTNGDVNGGEIDYTFLEAYEIFEESLKLAVSNE